MSNNNIIGRVTCPLCGEQSQDLKVNVNHKLYVFCDNGCTIKLNSAKSKRYLPVLLSGQDIRDDKLGLILSTCKGIKNEVIEKTKISNAGSSTGANDNTRNSTGTNTGSSTGNITGTRSSTGTNTGSAAFGRTDGKYTTGTTGRNTGSIIGRAAAWLAADDDE